VWWRGAKPPAQLLRGQLPPTSTCILTGGLHAGFGPIPWGQVKLLLASPSGPEGWVIERGYGRANGLAPEAAAALAARLDRPRSKTLVTPVE